MRYSESDVRNAARMLTGRTTDDYGHDVFDDYIHATGPITVLGFTHADSSATGGEAVGDAMRSYLATHPYTAQNLAQKLCVRYVSDSPSPELVAAVAQAYLDNKTQILPMSRTILCSDEFWSSRGQKVRRPAENLLAAMASQLVTARAAFGDTSTAPTENTLVVIFMRGSADGLRILVPNSPDLGLTYLREVRPSLLPANGNLLPLPGATGWALNSALKPLYNDGLWGSGELAYVPGVSTPAIPRSHFQGAGRPAR